MSREVLEYVVAARNLNIPWKQLAEPLMLSGEACRSQFRRAVNRFDEIQTKEVIKSLYPSVFTLN